MHDKYDILDGVAVASLGEVKSVFLAHRQPLEEIKEIHCDTASLAGFNLLKVLLAERGLKPTLTPLASYAEASTKENVFLIGDRAIDFLFGNYDHQIFDLGAAWYELTKLPFVYAVWALRRGVKNDELRRQLHSAKVFGMETLDNIINTRPEYTLDFRKDYLGWHIHYHLGTDERRGIAKFVELLRKHGLGPVYEPKFCFMTKLAIIVAFLASMITAMCQLNERAIDDLFRDFSGNQPGASVMVIRDGKPIFAKAYGMANVEQNVRCTTNSNFRLASVTKQFTAMGIMILVERGKLSFDDKITKFFPGFPKYGDQISVRHLLTHTSGVFDYDDHVPAGNYRSTQRQRRPANCQRARWDLFSARNQIPLQQFRLRAARVDHRKSFQSELRAVSKGEYL